MKNISYLQFLRYSLDDKQKLQESAKIIDWNKMLVWAERQSVVGIIFDGIQRAGKILSIHSVILYRWIGYVNLIESRNNLINKRCVELTDYLRHIGMESCILKGQGNAMMYPNPFLRTPGDIDVWVRSMSDGRCNKDEIIRYAKMQNPKAEVRIYHVEYEWKGIPVELHFMPGIMNNPYYNRRLQRWYNKKSDEEFTMAELPDGVGKIPIPTVEFNIVFQLAHMMHHFFDEGIGLRQFVDYYYLLKSVHGERLIVLGDVEETLKYLNLYSFAGAVMYIMKEVLGLEEEYLIVPVDERRGKTLLNEILKGGNFGHHSGLDQKNALKKYFQKTWRNMRLVKEYPAEALCEPFFRTWHFFWRLAH